MKNLKLVPLPIIALAQVYLVSGMDDQHLQKKCAEIDKQIQEASCLYPVLSNIVMEYADLKNQIQHAIECANKDIIKAIDNRNIEQVIDALSHGANPNAEYRHGKTLFVEAIRLGDYELVKILIDYGVDLLNEKDEYTMYDCAKDQYKTAAQGFKVENLLINYKKIMDLLSPDSEAKRKREKDEAETKRLADKDQVIKDKIRIAITKENNYMREQQLREEFQKEEESLRLQKAQEALAQLEAQPYEEENWEEQQEATEDWGELEQED